MNLSKLTSAKYVTLLFVTWRTLTLLVAYISPLLIPKFGAKFPYYEERLISTGLPHFIWSFGNFDGVHYLGIAKDAYAYQYTQAFFPLYPILIKMGSYLTLGNFVISALLISNIAFLAGLYLFHKLVSKTHGKTTANWSVVFLLAFPTSFFFGSVYTEGLFFLMIISFFYLSYLGKNTQAAIVGSFASATRLVGIFLASAFLAKKSKNVIFPLIVISGFLVYVVYLKIEFNNPLYFLNSQTIFGQGRETDQIILLPQVIWRYFKILTTTSGLALLTASFELISTVLAIFVLAIGLRKVKPEWMIFSIFSILTPTLTGTLTSMPRYILVAFPIFIILAEVKSTSIKLMLTALFLGMLILATALFTQGYWLA